MDALEPDAPDLTAARHGSRAAQQAATRRALLDAAYRIFARDGFHGAALDAIAAEAGYSKGAVYSNFDGKADLFLQVLDGLLDAVTPSSWDPIAMAATDDELQAVGRMPVGENLDDVQLSRGFGLATLELAAAAGRDPALMAALRLRLDVLIRGFTGFAAREQGPDDPLGADELGVLLAGLDQGFSLFALVGMPGVRSSALAEGLRRLLRS